MNKDAATSELASIASTLSELRGRVDSMVDGLLVGSQPSGGEDIFVDHLMAIEAALRECLRRIQRAQG